MTLRKVFSFARPLLTLLALFGAFAGVASAEPQLTVKSDDPLPLTLKENTPVTWTLHYKDVNGDRIKSKTMTLTPPDGKGIKVDGKSIGDDTKNGVDITWSAKLDEPGAYRAVFIVSTVGGSAQYPAPDAPEYRFTVENLLIKWGIFAGGVFIGLLFLPFLTYQIFRSMNQRGDPSGAARLALMIGILLCGGLFVYLFASVYGSLAYIGGIIIALALIVSVLTQRRG